MKFRRTPTINPAETIPNHDAPQPSFDPRLLAENINYLVLQDSIAISEPAPNVATEQSFWKPMELFLADPAEKEPLDERVEQSFFTATEVTESGAHWDILRSQMFLANFDLLATRGKGETIEASQIKRSYYLMAAALAKNRHSFHNTGSIANKIATMTTYALIARHGDPMNVPFVTSPREERTSSVNQRHNLYTIDDAITIKTALHVQSSPRKGVSHTPNTGFVLPYYSEVFLEKASRDLAYISRQRELFPTRSVTQIVARLIAKEGQGELFRENSMRAETLATLSERLIERVNDHRLELLGMSRSKTSQEAARQVARATPQLTVSRKLTPRSFLITMGRQTFANPYLNAEHIPPDILETQHIRPKDLTIGTIWKMIEIGLATGDRKHIVHASEEAQNIADDVSQASKDRVAAAMIAANSELFMLRGSFADTTPDDILKSYTKMATVLSKVSQLQYGQIAREENTGLKSELINFCLIAYNASKQHIPYLASHREERSPMVTNNYDVYTLSGKGRFAKTAAQVKTEYTLKYANEEEGENAPSRPDSPWLGTPRVPRRSFIFPVFLADVLQQTAVSLEMPRHKALATARRLVVQSVEGGLSEEEQLQMKAFSSAVLKLFVDHAIFLRNTKKYHSMPYTTASSTTEFLKNL